MSTRCVASVKGFEGDVILPARIRRRVPVSICHRMYGYVRRNFDDLVSCGRGGATVGNRDVEATYGDRVGRVPRKLYDTSATNVVGFDDVHLGGAFSQDRDDSVRHVERRRHGTKSELRTGYDVPRRFDFCYRSFERLSELLLDVVVDGHLLAAHHFRAWRLLSVDRETEQMKLSRSSLDGTGDHRKL